MRKNKIIGLLLCIVVCVQCFFLPVAVAEESAVSIEKELTVLTRLGVLEMPELDVFDITAPISRLDFTIYAAKLFQISKNIDGNAYFQDVPKEMEGFGYVSAMVDMGIIDQAADKRFNPNDIITYEQACKILLCGLGYNELTLAQYEKMMGYTIVARKVGMELDLPNLHEMTFCDAMQLMYNALNIELVEFAGEKNGNPNYKVSDRTLATLNRMYTEQGVVEAVNGSCIQNTIAIEADQVMIDGTVFKVYSGFSVQDALLASTVEYIYIKDKDSGFAELVYAEKLNPSNELVILSEYIIGYTENSVSYYLSEESSVTRSAVFQSDPLVLYNGSPYVGKISNLLQDFVDEECAGTIRMIRNGSAGYHTLIIDSYTIFVAGSYDEENGILYSYNNSAAAIDLSKYDHVRIVNGDGKEIALPKTQPQIIAAAVSVDGKSCKLIVSSATEAGTVEYISDSNRTVGINGKHWKLTKKIWEAYSGKLHSGAAVKLYLDHFGRVAYCVEQSNDGMNIGYLVNLASQQNVFESSFLFKLYTEEGMKEFTLAKKVSLDGINYDSSDWRNFFYNFPGVSSMQYIDGEPTVEIERQLIRYHLNTEGELAVIDTYKVGDEDSEYSLTRTYDGTNKLLCHAGDKRLSLTGYYNLSQTKLFTVPPNDGTVDLDDEKNYGNTASFITDGKYEAEVYYFNGDTFYADAIVVHTQSTLENENVYMFSHLETALDSDGEKITKVIAYCNGVQEELLISDEKPNVFDDIDEGDLFSTYVGFDQKTVQTVTKYYDMSEDVFVGSYTNGHWYNASNPDEIEESSYRGVKYNLTKSYAYDVKNSAIKSIYEPSELKNGKANEIQEINQYRPMTHYNSEKRTDKISKGAVEDIRTYKNVGYNCSKLLYVLKQGGLKQVFVYN